MNISIALATEANISEIQSILEYGIRRKMHRGDLAWGESITDAAELNAIIKADNMYIARNNNGLVAVFMLFWDDSVRWGQQPPVAGYLHRFVVVPGFRGQHVGDQILSLICAEVAKHDRQFLRLTCPLDNQQLQAYHLKNGFNRADSKAHPKYLQEPMAFFEKAVNNLPDSSVINQPKSNFITRIRHIHFGQRYE